MPSFRTAALSVLILVLCAVTTGARAEAEAENQLYTLAFGNWNFVRNWSASMQVENRLTLGSSGSDTTIYKPGVYYWFSPTLEFGVGYKFIDNDGPEDEQDLWQELFHTKQYKSISFMQQFRLEERFKDDVDGTVYRFRYLAHWSIPLSDRNYLAVQNATRFNLNDQGVGPVKGFEQNRLYFGYGWHVGKNWRIEAGYMWRYQRERSGPDSSDNIARFQFLYSRSGVRLLRAGN